MQADFSSGGCQNYLHHMLGIVGSVIGMYGGGYLLVTASVSALTEVSTPFVNVRAMLYDLKMGSSSIYAVNGLFMTLFFFIFRCVFQAYLVVFKLWP